MRVFKTVGSTNPNGKQQVPDPPRSFADITAGRSSQNHKGDWSKLVGDKKLPSYEPVLIEGKGLVQIPAAVCENAPALWEDILVGQFVGSALNIVRFKAKLIFFGVGNVQWMQWLGEMMLTCLNIRMLVLVSAKLRSLVHWESSYTS